MNERKLFNIISNTSQMVNPVFKFEKSYENSMGYIEEDIICIFEKYFICDNIMYVYMTNMTTNKEQILAINPKSISDIPLYIMEEQLYYRECFKLMQGNPSKKINPVLIEYYKDYSKRGDLTFEEWLISYYTDYKSGKPFELVHKDEIVQYIRYETFIEELKRRY